MDKCKTLNINIDEIHEMTHKILPTQLLRWITPQSPSRRFTAPTTAPAPITRAISKSSMMSSNKVHLPHSFRMAATWFFFSSSLMIWPNRFRWESDFPQWLFFYGSNLRFPQHRTSTLSQSPFPAPPAPPTPQTRPHPQVQIQSPLIILFSTKGRVWQAWQFHVPRGRRRVASMKL